MPNRVVFVWQLAALAGLAGCAADRDFGSISTASFCDVAPLLSARCVTCHSDPPQFGAPMPLVTGAQYLAEAARIEARLHDRLHPMPPNALLSDAEIAEIEGFLASDDHASTCVAGPAGTGNAALPCQPDLFATASVRPTTDAVGPPYVLSAQADTLACFAMRIPAQPGRTMIAGGPLVDAKRYLHHMVLYKQSGTLPDGVTPCADRAADATPILRWEPGQGALVMPPDVALELGDGEIQLLLEIHYVNPAQIVDAHDSSGFALCTTSAPRPHVAQLVTLGTVDFALPASDGITPVQASLTNTCAPAFTGEVHVLSAAPHMHNFGRTVRTEILHADGTSSMLVDVPKFTPEFQPAYPSTTVVRPGDALRTTCTYQHRETHPVYYGTLATDEMCFDYVVAWPAGALSMPGSGAGTCMDPAEIASHPHAP